MRYLFLMACIVCACKSLRSNSKQSFSASEVFPQTLGKDTIICPDDEPGNSSGLIPSDLFAPKDRNDICGWTMPEDTLTPKGNFLKYWISNDSCCRSNLYLEWGNSQFKRIINLGGLRQFNSRMTPFYVGDSNKHLFLESATSGGMPILGWNLWVLPLSPDQDYETYDPIEPDAYDLASMTIIQEVDKPDIHAWEAYNIRTHRAKPICFKHRLLQDVFNVTIDSISITPKTIFLSVETNDGSVQEVLVLANDIK